MKAKLTLKPGQHGTRQLTEKFGDRLLFVRYRYDQKNNKKYKTVELIVEESGWIATKNSIPKYMVVGVRIDYDEKELQNTVKKK